MTSVISRSDLISAVINTVEDRDTQQLAMRVINRAYIDEHTGSFSDDDESMFFNLVTHYDTLHQNNPARFNQQAIMEAANGLHV